ncbi:hypothetical protein ASG52_23060 [Methylobacterium sp. Leaf456]|uniref:hypothetical protein n=1 Tax=Methylobacterium sp. Leaf456 TaxID=1736382 RepID=UPI000701FA9A|nr:hypothetical protein [Methylobacterium sp. Leaf456]KQT58092.1 hypothetical protein ASG52_23060 [Methylobacterium sp. Leaf456]
MSDAPHPVIDETDEASGDLELLGQVLAQAEAAIELIDAVQMPRSHAALMTLLSRLGYEIERAKPARPG